MSAAVDTQESPEWAAARNDWREQADASLAGLQTALQTATPDSLDLETIYAPVHDLAGLAPVFEYHLLGSLARSLMEALRAGPNPLNEGMINACRAYVTAMSALHAKDVRGEVGAEGDAILAKLASVHP